MHTFNICFTVNQNTCFITLIIVDFLCSLLSSAIFVQFTSSVQVIIRVGHSVESSQNHLSCFKMGYISGFSM